MEQRILGSNSETVWPTLAFGLAQIVTVASLGSIMIKAIGEIGRQ